MIHFGHESVGGFMRGRFRDQGGLFSYLSPEARVPAKHPLRQVRQLVRAVLKDLSPSFGKLYSSAGRPELSLNLGDGGVRRQRLELSA
jgi:hypothetical protein